jgi:hypothetical protein
MMASASGACAQDSKLTVRNVTVTAPAPPAPVAPPFVQSLYGGYRVEEDKFGEVPCSQTFRAGWACDASSGKTAKSPWSTGSKKKDGSSIPLGGGPRRPMAPMAAAPRKGSGRSSTICVLLTMATDDHPSGL